MSASIAGQLPVQEYDGFWKKDGGRGEWFRISEGHIVWPNDVRDKLEPAGGDGFRIRRADQVHHLRFTAVSDRPRWLTWNDGSGGTFVRDDQMLAPLVSEFVGTFFLVFVIGCGRVSGVEADWVPTSAACALVSLIYALGIVSRGHLNPAVSVAAGLARKVPWLKVLPYVVAQLFGASAACLSYTRLFSPQSTRIEPGIGFDWWQALVAEAVFTAVLAFVVLNVAYSTRNNPSGNPNGFHALAIGFAVIAGGHAAGPISGGVFNPAASLALDASSYGEGLRGGAAFAGVQVLGGVIAAGLFRLVRPEDHRTLGEDDDNDDDEWHDSPAVPTKLACEFVGSFVLALTAALCSLAGSPAGPWALAAAVTCMVYSLGDISGGHFNPAVTLALVCNGRQDCQPSEGWKYVLVQAAAASIAVTLATGIYMGATVPVEVRAPVGVALVSGTPSWAAGCELEAVFTFALVFVVLVVSCSRTNYYGLAIGAAVAAGGFASHSVSGGALNPALVLGSALNDWFLNGGSLDTAWRLCLAEFLGGGLAVLLFSVTHAHEHEQGKK